MKAAVVAAFAAVLSASQQVFAADSYLEAMAEKGNYGLFNLGMGVVEPIVQIVAWGIDFERADRPAIGGLIVGAVAAPAAVTGRAWEGATSLLTFPIALPGQHRDFKLCQLGCKPLTSQPQ
jgi:hypothetical protein